MSRLKRYLNEKFIKPIFTINDTPHSIALGVALGVFVALTPTVGLQMLIILVLGTLIRANRIIGVLLVWISNPITIIPMYYGYYWLGAKLLDVELWTFETFSMKVDGVMTAHEQTGWFGVIQKLSSDIGPSLFLGSLIIATVCSLPLYPWVLHALNKRKNHDPGNAEGDTPPGDSESLSRDKQPEPEEPVVPSKGGGCTTSMTDSCCKKAEPISNSDA